MNQMRIARIQCSPEEVPFYLPEAKILKRYKAFQLVELSAVALQNAARTVPVEDITPLYKIRLGRRLIDTARKRTDPHGRARAHPAETKIESWPRGDHHYVVQFVGPIKQSWRRAVEDAGGTYRSPLRNFACIFQLAGSAVEDVRKLSCVRWIGRLPYDARVAKSAHRPRKRDQLRTDAVVLQFFDRNLLKQARAKIARAGARLLSVERAAALLVVEIPKRGPRRRITIRKLSEIHGVRLISPKAIPSVCNNIARAIMGTARSAAPVTSQGLGLTGKGEIIAIADTGLDTGDPKTVMADFAGRIGKIFCWPMGAGGRRRSRKSKKSNAAVDGSSGHGTHIAGSAVGAGSKGPGDASNIRGLAYRAKLVFQAVKHEVDLSSGQSGKCRLTGLPDDLGQLFQEAYQAKARIHSNSWYGAMVDDYDPQSRQVDEFLWGHPDFCVLFDAGNEGRATESHADGRVDERSVTFPGTAKNCITVGASESERPEFDRFTYESLWLEQPLAPPLCDEKVADCRDEVAAFSSRGPTSDNRVKPDIVAPGTAILSTRSTQLPRGLFTVWGQYPENGNYWYDGGTSQATALTAGAVALIREYYRTRKGKKRIKDPSAALLKATLICGAVRLSLPYVAANVVADYHQGFGRVDLDEVLASPSGRILEYVDYTTGLVTGKPFERIINVPGARPLRVVLAYTDCPGFGLKNDLNLQLVRPDGSWLCGNDLESKGEFDHSNNVEVVNVALAEKGMWHIRVIAQNVPEGPQPFALVWLV